MDPTTEYLVLLFFHEIPNKAAAIVALVLFAIISVAVTAITIKTRCYYMLTVAITGYLEMGGEVCCTCWAAAVAANYLLAAWLPLRPHGLLWVILSSTYTARVTYGSPSP